MQVLNGVTDNLNEEKEVKTNLFASESVTEGQVSPADTPLFAFTWKSSGFSSCTSSCLGGLQESIVTCVESSAGTTVLPYFCDPNTKPEIEVRISNEKACPPRWNISDFSDCSKSCGGGVQTRELQCVQEVRWPLNTIILFISFSTMS